MTNYLFAITILVTVIAILGYLNYQVAFSKKNKNILKWYYFNGCCCLAPQYIWIAGDYFKVDTIILYQKFYF